MQGSFQISITSRVFSQTCLLQPGNYCAKVYPEGVLPIKGNHCGLIPSTIIFRQLKFSSLTGSAKQSEILLVNLIFRNDIKRLSFDIKTNFTTEKLVNKLHAWWLTLQQLTALLTSPVAQRLVGEASLLSWCLVLVCSVTVALLKYPYLYFRERCSCLRVRTKYLIIQSCGVIKGSKRGCDSIKSKVFKTEYYRLECRLCGVYIFNSISALSERTKSKYVCPM